MKNVNLVLVFLMVVCIQYGCQTKTKSEYCDEVNTSMKVFKHTPMPVYKDTSIEKYGAYVEEMCRPYFGDHCDYLMDMNNGTFMVINADNTLGTYDLRIQIGVSSGNAMYNNVANGLIPYAISTWKDVNSIRISLPRPEELKSKQVWALVCTHEAVHMKTILNGKNLQGANDELPAYLAEKKVFDTMDPEWNKSFYTAFTPFYEEYGFCNEMFEAINKIFDIQSLTKIEESNVVPGIMFFIAMESKGVGNDDQKKLKEIIDEMNVFLQANGNVKYY